MKNKFLFFPAAVLSGIVASILPVYGQAIPDYLQQELNKTNILINEANEYLETVIYPQVEAQQIYEQQLYNYCLAGNNNACLELQSIEQRRTQWMIQNDCRYRTGLNSCYR